MSLTRRGALFAGALYAGMLFGPQPASEETLEYHGGGQREESLYREVLDQWELLGLRRQWAAPAVEPSAPDGQDKEPEATVTVDLAMPLTRDAATGTRALPYVDAVLAKAIADRDAALQRKRNEEALLLILAQLDDDEIESVNITVTTRA